MKKILNVILTEYRLKCNEKQGTPTCQTKNTKNSPVHTQTHTPIAHIRSHQFA